MHIHDQRFYASLDAAVNEPQSRFRQTIIRYDTNGKIKKITTCNVLTRGMYWLCSKLFGYKDVRVLDEKQKHYVQVWSQTRSQPTSQTAAQIYQAFRQTISNEEEPPSESAISIVKELCETAVPSTKDMPIAERIRYYLGKDQGRFVGEVKPGGNALFSYGISGDEVCIMIRARDEFLRYYIDQKGGVQRAVTVYDGTTYTDQARETIDSADLVFQEVCDLVIANMG